MKTIAIFFNDQKERAVIAADALQTWLVQHDYRFIVENVTTSSDNRIKTADFIVSLGGDGTTLRAARLASQYNIPILGVSLGTLGFLAEVSTENLYTAIEYVYAGNYHIDERSMLMMEIMEEDQRIESAYALNEVVIAGSRPKMLTMDLLVSGNYVSTYSADGMIISSPTGSTAYNLSAGGPILSPQVDATIITPLCAHSLNLRSLVVAGYEQVVIRPGSDSNFHSALASVDGQLEFPLKDTYTISISKPSKSIRFIRFNDFCFFEALRSKLKWSGKVH